MTMTSIGDLAQNLINRNAHARLNRDLGVLSQELTTGLKTDRRSAASGDIAGYAALERRLISIDSFSVVATESGHLAQAQNAVIGNVASQIELVLPTLLTGGAALGSDDIARIALDAEKNFEATVAALNTRLGDRFLFSGTATSNAPLRNGADILADISSAVSAAGDASAVIDAIDQYFAPGGGFETNDYIGGTDPSVPIQIAPGDTVSLQTRADDEPFRETLSGLAKIAVLKDLMPPIGDLQSTLVLDDARNQLLRADTDLIGVRADIGFVEAQIDTAQSRMSAERTSLQQARLDLIGADPYDTAVRLEQTQLQLEQLYTVTARLSRLSLVNYL